MIRNESEYREAVQRVTQEKDRLDEHRKHLKEAGLTADQVSKALEPVRAFHLQLVEEVAAYERLRRGEFEEIHNFQGFGQLLVALRVSLGITQRELAKRLGVDETQISRDERNEYHNIGVDRAEKILQALGVTVKTVVERVEGRAA